MIHRATSETALDRGGEHSGKLIRLRVWEDPGALAVSILCQTLLAF